MDAFLFTYGGKMKTIEEIRKMIAQMKQIAMLHSKELKNTKEMPNWNETYTYLLRLKGLTEHGIDMQTIQALANKLTSPLVEMKMELYYMIPCRDLEKALSIHKELEKEHDELLVTLKEEVLNQEAIQNNHTNHF